MGVHKGGIANFGQVYWINKTIKKLGDWVEITVTPSVAFGDFYSGYAEIWFEPVVFDGALKVDIKTL